MNNGVGCKEFLENPLGNLVKLVGVQSRREQRDMQLAAHGPKFRVRHLGMGHYPHRRLENG